MNLTKDDVSVTQALSIIHNENLERWRGDVGNAEADRKLKAGQDYGTRVHEAIERIAKDGFMVNDNVDMEINDSVLNICKWLSANVLKIIMIENRIRSDKYKYHGKLDILAMLKDKKEYIIDVKTGNWKDLIKWPLQTSAYKNLGMETGATDKRCGRIILHAPKDGSFEAIPLAPRPKDFTMFLYTLELYRSLKRK